MKKHFKKMDRCSYLNASGEIVKPTLEQQTPLFVNSFWGDLDEKDPETYKHFRKYLDKEQDYMFYELNYRDRMNRKIERFLLENIKTPIYI
jgi:hypothetical protein